MHPQVQLLVAAHPRTPVALLAQLRKSDDIFVRRLAAIHPSLPLDDRLAAALDAGAPAWVVRRVAADPSLAPEERARLDVRLAAGDLDGDPDFDPIECVGSPGVTGEPEEAAYRRFASNHGVRSSLWRARKVIAADMKLLDEGKLAALAEDSHDEVRAAVARLEHRDTLKQLRSDSSAAVRAEAEATLAQLPRVPIRRRLAPVLVVLAALAVLPLGIVLFTAAGKGANEADALKLPPSVDIGRWLPGSVDAPAGNALCRAGGTTVWFTETDDVLYVVVAVDAAREVTITLVSPERSIPKENSLVLGSGEVRSFEQPLGESGVLSVAIGDNPTETIDLRMGAAGEPGVSDAQGDC